MVDTRFGRLGRRTLAFLLPHGIVVMAALLLCGWVFRLPSNVELALYFVSSSLFWTFLWARWEVSRADGTSAETLLRPGFLRAFMLGLAATLVGFAALALVAAR